MEKETYDIEDILSEVRKRREENSSENAQSNSDKPSEKEHKAKQPQPRTEQPSAKSESAESTFEKIIEKSEPVTFNPAPTEEKKYVPEVIEEKADTAEPVEEDAQESAPSGMVDLFSLSDEAEIQEEAEEITEEPEKQKFFATKKGRILKTVIICFVLLIFAVGIFAGIYIYKQINNMSESDSKSPGQQQEEEWQGMSKLVEKYPEIQETDASQLASLQDMIKTWYYNGEPCSSTHVLNVLLLGEDTRGDDILEEGTRADSAIIVSVNIDTGKITLTSVLRDAYAYWEAKPGDESTGVFEKINGAMNLEGGNIHTYINAVERLYKINIDDYVIVNFDSFRKIIDAMGGVTLEITSAEISEINNHPKRYGNVYIEQTFEGSSGEMLLDGSQALAYCRIRHLDSDNKRADRQKITLMTIFEQAKDESKGTLIKMINALMPYVKTGFSTKNIISIAKYALTEGWFSYDIEMISVPNARINEIGGESYGAWCWRPDFPQDAHYLQTLLYGKSGITLAQTRVDVAKCESYGFFSEGSYPVTSTIYNNAFGEATTYEEMTTEQEETSSSTSN